MLTRCWQRLKYSGTPVNRARCARERRFAGQAVDRSVDEGPFILHRPGDRQGAVDKSGHHRQMVNANPSYYHLHLVSDATGETLTTIAKAASVQYATGAADRACASAGQVAKADAACAPGNRAGAGHRALHYGQPGLGAHRAKVPGTEDPGTRRPQSYHAGVRSLFGSARHRRLQASTCSMPIISAASMR